MAANRALTLLLLFVAAVACYAIGFYAWFWLLVVIGAGFELAFWFQLIVRRRSR